MENNKKEYQQKDPKAAHDTTKRNSREGMPIKNIATDTKSNTAAEEGLNQAGNPANALEPGTKKGDE